MAIEWQTTPATAFSALGQDYRLKVYNAIHILALRYAPEIETWMKQNAPWTDRTGNARQSLYSDVRELIGSIIIFMSHGPNIPYGRYLENNYGGRYAVIGPALDHFTPRVWADVRRLMGG